MDSEKPRPRVLTQRGSRRRNGLPLLRLPWTRRGCTLRWAAKPLTVIKRFGVMIFLLVGGCGPAPTEARLTGTWQVDLPPPQKVIYTFQKDHTYTMNMAGQPGAMQGTWELKDGKLKMSMDSFLTYGTTNLLPAIKSLNSQQNTIVELTESTMLWRGGRIGKRLKLKRIVASPNP